jgi:hypothetical protein
MFLKVISLYLFINRIHKRINGFVENNTILVSLLKRINYYE